MTERSNAALDLSANIVIKRPIEQVWAYMNDEANDLRWRRPYTKQLRRTGPLGLGTRFEGVDNMGAYITEITHYEPPLRLSWRELSLRPMHQRSGSYILASEGADTRVTIQLTFDTIGLRGRVMRVIASFMLPRLVPKLADQLKEGIEGTRPS